MGAVYAEGRGKSEMHNTAHCMNIIERVRYRLLNAIEGVQS